MFNKRTLSLCVLSLTALMPLRAFSQDVTGDNQDHIDDPSPKRFVDFYKGSKDEQDYLAKLKSSSKGGLYARAAGLRGEIALSCGVSATLVGASALAETLPCFGMFPRIATTKTEAENGDFNAGRDEAVQMGATLGGAISAVVGTLNLGIMALTDGKLTHPYLLTREAYWGTTGVAADLFSRSSGCRKTLDQLADVKAEMKTRRMSKNPKYAPWPAPQTDYGSPMDEPRNEDRQDAKTAGSFAAPSAATATAVGSQTQTQ